MSIRLKLLLVVLLPCLLAPAGAAMAQSQEAWLVTTSDFTTRRAALLGLEASGARVEQIDGAVDVPAARLVRLERVGATDAARAAEGLVLHLRNGERLHGQMRAMTDEALEMDVPGVGRVQVPLELLLAVVRPDAPEADQPWRQPPPPADEILLANRDRLTGYVSAISPEAWTLSSETGAQTPIATDAILQVRFADPGVPAPAEEARWQVRLTGGSLLHVPELSFQNRQFSFTYRGRPWQIGESAMAWVEQVDGPVRWLSDLPTLEQEHTPYFSAAFPPQVDGLPEGSGRGFIVRSRSRLVFELPEGYERFRVRYAMPPEMIYGNADVRILLDERLVHEHAGLTAATRAQPVEVPLEGARRLVLEVDWGQGLDVQDVVLWIEPALVR